MQESEIEELKVLSKIREALGVGEKPMLSELPGIVRELKDQNIRNEITLKEMNSGLSSYLTGLNNLQNVLDKFLLAGSCGLGK